MSAPDPAELWREVLAWIRVAGNDLRIAELCLNAEPPASEGAAFHCQQAAEKLLKGFLVRACTDFGKTHDLHYLGTVVARLFPQVRSLVQPMAAWTHWAVAYRYPGDPGPEPKPTIEELRQALALTGELEAALRALAPRAPAQDGSRNSSN